MAGGWGVYEKKGRWKGEPWDEGGGYSDVRLEGLRCIKGGAAPCRESGLFIYCKEAVSLQGFPGELVPITTSAPAPTLRLGTPVKLHPVREGRKRERKIERQKRGSPPIAPGRVLFCLRLELKMGETTQCLCLGTKENKQTPNAIEVLIKSQAALQLRCAASQNKKLFVVGLFTLPPSYSTCFLNLLQISLDFLFFPFAFSPPPCFHLAVCEK